MLARGAQLAGRINAKRSARGPFATTDPHKNSTQSEGGRRLYRATAQDSAGASRDIPGGRTGAQSRIVRVQDEPHRQQDLQKKRAPGGCGVKALGKEREHLERPKSAQGCITSYKEDIMLAGSLTGLALCDLPRFVPFCLVMDSGCAGPYRPEAEPRLH